MLTWKLRDAIRVVGKGDMEMNAQQIADMANRAETEILKSMDTEMRNWYLRLPRERRVHLVEDAVNNAALELTK